MRTPFITIALWGLSAVILLFWTWPAFQEFSLTRQALKAQEAELQSRENYFSQLAALHKQLQTYASELARLDAALPSTPSLPQLYDTVQDIAASSGLVLTNVSAVTADTGMLKETEVKLTVEGSYAGLKEFLQKVQESPRLLKVKSLDFTTPKEGSRFEFHINLLAYSY